MFGIVLNCITHNNSYCLHLQYFSINYLRQMHQIIHLSPVGCFTPARGKTMQKNREVSDVKQINVIHMIHSTIIDTVIKLILPTYLVQNTTPVKVLTFNFII